MKKIVPFFTAVCMAAATALPAWSASAPTHKEDKVKLTGIQAGSAKAHLAPEDTIIIKLANDAKMTLYLKNRQQLQSFQQHSLDSLMILLNEYVAKAEQQSASQNNKEVTVVFNPAADTDRKDMPSEVKVTVRNTAAGAEASNRTEVISLGAMNIVVKYDEEGNADDIKITAGKNKNTDAEQQNEADKDKDEKCCGGKNKSSRSDNNFNLDFGLNTWIAEDNMSVPDLKPWGSRYVSLNWHYTYRLGGERSPLHLLTGFEFGFNNYMFEDNILVVNENRTTAFVTDTTRDFEKSKLATSTINVPLMLQLDFKSKEDNETVFKFGVGGFAGYRLGAHTKLKYQVEGDTKKDKDRGSFNLEDFQYGLTAVAGYKNVDMFFKYNLNTMFKEDRGPEVNTIGFGFRLFND